MQLLFDTAIRCGPANKRELKMELLKLCITMGKKHEDETGEAAAAKENLSAAFKAWLERMNAPRGEITQKANDRQDRPRFVSDVIFLNDRELKAASWFVAPHHGPEMKPYRIQLNARLEIAKEYKKQGDIEKELDIYELLLGELKCIDELELLLDDAHTSFNFLFPSTIRMSGYKAVVEHAGKTGVVIAHPAFINPIDEADPVFTREETPITRQSAPAAGSTHWHQYGYADYLAFAAPSGKRIAEVIVQPINVRGRLMFEIGNENPLESFRFGKGPVFSCVFEKTQEKAENESEQDIKPFIPFSINSDFLIRA